MKFNAHTKLSDAPPSFTLKRQSDCWEIRRHYDVYNLVLNVDALDLLEDKLALVDS